MRPRLFMAVVWLMASFTAIAQGVSFPTGQHPAQPLPSTLSELWKQIANETNSWARTLRKDAGWETLASQPLTQVRSAAEQGMGAAQLRLGYCYFLGDGVERDVKEALVWLHRAADQGLAPAQFMLGEACLQGIGTSQDFAQGVDWLDKAAEQGFGDAQLLLGLCYLSGGPGVNEAPARGLKWLVRAAEQGNAVAQQSAGECYLVGNGARPDEAEAARWFTRAAECGLATAQNLLAGCYLRGRGVATNSALAYAWYSRAAGQGLGLAQAALARCCARGLGVPQNAADAMKWWGKAAANAYPGAEFHLGLGYYSGEGEPLDFERAVACFQKDAGRSHVGAMLYLGLCYWQGKGVPHDAERAQKWWGDACLEGIVPRRYLLADEALSDAPEVERWWRDVAAQASGSLQCCLAESYHFGHGVEPDDTQAVAWYRRAADHGDKVALKQAAWLLATSPNPKVRDGTSAVAFAKKAGAAAQHRDAAILDTLAAAYAEAGQFEKAIRAAQEAIQLAGRADERAEYQSRLKLYQAHTPYRSEP